MPDRQSSRSIAQRYTRAASFTGPKLAARTPNVALDGYWIDDDRFFFISERFDASLGRIVPIPTMVDARSASAEEIMPPEALLSAIRAQTPGPIAADSLSSAQFDMPDNRTLAASIDGWDYLIDVHDFRVRHAGASLALPALYSPDGRHACVVGDHDLYLRDRLGGAERPLTSDGTALWCYGRSSETALQAISYRKRPVPIGLWSQDSRWLLTHRIDERALPDLAVLQHVPPGGGRPVVHRFQYSMPGDALPVGHLVAIEVETGRHLAFGDVPFEVPAFSPISFRKVWFEGKDRAWFIRIDRYCRRAELISLDLENGTARTAITETVESGYLDVQRIVRVTPNVRTLTASDEIIWFSERDGWGHLYLYRASTGALKNQITTGNFTVRDIVDVDETRRRVLFLAAGIDANADPARRSLCRVNLDGSGFEVLLAGDDHDIFVPPTEPAGFRQDRPFRPSYARAGVSPDGRMAITRSAGVERGNFVRGVELETGRGFGIASAPRTADDVLARNFSAWAADGTTRLHGVMFLPEDFAESELYPLIDCIYPGPQITNQPQALNALRSAQAMALAQLGCVTIMLDTRGMPIRDRAFHQAGYGQLLEPQLADHACVVRQLCDRHGFIDRRRIGMIGTSGGGAATARALFDYPEVFKVGVAAAGNHDSNLYSAAWSDKYRGPGGPARFSDQANSAAAHKLQGRLLLIHGDMDENVHVANTLALVDALIKANKNFELLIVPNAGHTVLWTNGFAQRRTWDFMVRHLIGETPPDDFELEFAPHELARHNIRGLSEPIQ